MRSLLARWLGLRGIEPIEELTGARVPPVAGERTCEYCACRLTANGEVLQMSDKARALRTLEDRLVREQEDHARTKTELTAARESIASLQAQLTPDKPKAGLGLFK